MLDTDVPQVLVSLADVHALDSLGRLTSVLSIQNKHSVRQKKFEKGYNLSLNTGQTFYFVLQENVLHLKRNCGLYKFQMYSNSTNKETAHTHCCHFL